MAADDESAALQGIEEEEETTCSLQEAFKVFREKKRVSRDAVCVWNCTLHNAAYTTLQKELREQNRARSRVPRDEAALATLRSLFLQTALSYCGVPYARRYHQPDCESWSLSVTVYV